MTSEQTERMSDAVIKELIMYAATSDIRDDVMVIDLMRAVDQLRSDLAAMKERAEMAEHDAAVKKNTLAIMQDQAKKHHAEVERVRTIGLEYANDLTEAREQLAVAVEALEQLSRVQWVESLSPRQNMNVVRDFARDTLSRLSPSPKQTAGGGEG